MSLFKRTALAAALFLATFQPLAAQWQTPQHSVPIGNGGGHTGFSSVVPTADNAGAPLTSNGAAADPSFQPIVACTLAYQITKFVTGSGWQCGTLPVLPSYAVAATLNLAAFTGISTQGYTTAGDGGGAALKNVGTTPFVDTHPLTGTIAAGSGYTNGTFRGQSFSGGTGALLTATVTVTGGVVTDVTVTTPGQGYSVGDVLTDPGLAGGSGFSWTVSTISAPTCSLTDTSGAHFQIAFPGAGIDVRACGVKFDWTVAGGDAAATDNYTTLTNAFMFASAERGGGGPDTGGTIGGRALLPPGSAMFCGSNGAAPLVAPLGVWVLGHGAYDTVLKVCDTWGTATNYIEMCDTQSHIACFSTLLDSFQVFAKPLHDFGISTTNGLNAVYTNSCQQEGCGLRNMTIYPGACRRGFTYESGFGGASLVRIIENVEVKGGVAAPNCGGAGAGAAVIINLGTTLTGIYDLTIGGLSPGAFHGPRDNGLLVTGGFVDINGFYAEQVVNPFLLNITPAQGGLSAGMVSMRRASAGVDCNGLVELVAGNTNANFKLEGPTVIGGCTTMVNNGQSGGTNYAGPANLPVIFNPSASQTAP